MSTYTYKGTKPGVWTVGYYDPAGTWVPDSDHDSVDEAVARVRRLGGAELHETPATLLTAAQQIRLSVAELLAEHGTEMVGVSGDVADDWSVRSLTRDVLHLAAAIETGVAPELAEAVSRPDQK